MGLLSGPSAHLLHIIHQAIPSVSKSLFMSSIYYLFLESLIKMKDLKMSEARISEGKAKRPMPFSLTLLINILWELTKISQGAPYNNNSDLWTL